MDLQRPFSPLHHLPFTATRDGRARRAAAASSPCMGFAARAFLVSLLLLEAMPSNVPLPPNVLTFLIDDMDLERVPFYPRLDDGAAEQLRLHQRSGGCRAGANCTYSAPHIESIGGRGVRFLGAHVPVSVCTPSRYALLTGRMPSSSPFYSATLKGHESQQVDISWNTWIEQGQTGPPCCGPGVPQPCRVASMWGCARKAKTLGSMLQAAGYFTGFVGKWHLSPVPGEVAEYHRGGKGTLRLEDEAGSAALQSAFERARESHLYPLVRRTGFNYTGAVSAGNVVDLAPLGVAVHNMDWEAEAALRFLDMAHAHVDARRAAGYYLHVCTTLTHSPGPMGGICADPRLSEGGLLATAPVGLPTRASIQDRTGGRRCGWQVRIRAACTAKPFVADLCVLMRVWMHCSLSAGIRRLAHALGGRCGGRPLRKASVTWR